jgi:hypothetical protein
MDNSYHTYTAILPFFAKKIQNFKLQHWSQIAELGFNVVRLGAMWTGVEPEEDNFNKTYLDIIEVWSQPFDLEFNSNKLKSISNVHSFIQIQ